MQGHEPLVVLRAMGQWPRHHVLVQTCRWLPERHDNITIIARSWRDAELDWSCMKDVFVEILFEYATDFQMVVEIATAIMLARPAQLFITCVDTGVTHAIFWEDIVTKTKLEFLELWT